MTREEWESLPKMTRFIALVRIPLWWPYVLVVTINIVAEYVYWRTLHVWWNWPLRMKPRLADKASRWVESRREKLK